jgi:2-phosphosulfolactate phosphatase
MEHRFVSNDECADVDGVVVVIDVLRAFSFCAFVLAAGVDRIVLMADLDRTLEAAAAIPGALAGKDGAPAAGFELFNSPGQVLERDDLAGRTLVHRSTAGTVGAYAARHADHVFCASFVVASATADRVRALEPDGVTYVVTGNEGRADDDLACAEYLVELVEGRAPDPAPPLARVAKVGERLREAAATGRFGGVHEDDVDLCCELDRFDFAMRARNEGDLLVLRKG